MNADFMKKFGFCLNFKDLFCENQHPNEIKSIIILTFFSTLMSSDFCEEELYLAVFLGEFVEVLEKLLSSERFLCHHSSNERLNNLLTINSDKIEVLKKVKLLS